MRRTNKSIGTNNVCICDSRQVNPLQPEEEIPAQKLGPTLFLSHPAKPFLQIYDVVGKWSTCQFLLIHITQNSPDPLLASDLVSVSHAIYDSLYDPVVLVRNGAIKIPSEYDLICKAYLFYRQTNSSVIALNLLVFIVFKGIIIVANSDGSV